MTSSDHRPYLIARHGAAALLALALVLASTPAKSVLIDFDTQLDGTPYMGPVDFFDPDEYAPLGVSFASSSSIATKPLDPDIRVDEVNPINMGTSISGFHINVFSGPVDAVLEIFFGTSVSDVAFDFATARNFSLNALALDVAGNTVSNTSFTGGDPFRSQSGALADAGQAALGGIGPISKLVLTTTPGNSVIFLDNLSFSQIAVPEPPSLALLALGLLLLLGGRPWSRSRLAS